MTPLTISPLNKLLHAAAAAAICLAAGLPLAAQTFDISDVDPQALPQVPVGFKVGIYAKEPLVRNPAAIAFDIRGRVFVGGGPQFRMPTAETPPDSIWQLIDRDEDGVADEHKVFATGFNSIQSLAWKGRDLWVANAPDLTVARDLDGDDVADEYEVIYTGLGTLEHGLHGLTWGPDGKLYMSKGDTTCQPDAPRPFRELMHVKSAEPDTQKRQLFVRRHSQKESVPSLTGLWYGDAGFTRPQGKTVLRTLDHDGTWPGVYGTAWSARWQGTITPEVTGEVAFRAESPADVRIEIAGRTVFDSAAPEATRTVALTTGQRVPIVVELSTSVASPRLKVEWGWKGSWHVLVPDRPELSPDDASSIYRARFETPTDPHTEGGILRSSENGERLEIVCRGLRNPWDIAIDENFNWLSTDNDPSGGDKVIAPFYGAHFGHHHPWSYNWADDSHLPTVPTCGPVWEGSGVGVLFARSKQFPPEWRDLWLIGDWLNGSILVMKPQWAGASVVSETGPEALQPFAAVSDTKSLFRVTDFEWGPDGALWICSWGRNYGATWNGNELTNEGRVYRIWHEQTPLQPESPEWDTAQLASWTIENLVSAFDSLIPARRVAAQDELLRQGPKAVSQLVAALSSKALSAQQVTWVAWTLGRSSDISNSKLAELVRSDDQNLRLQAVRILAFRVREGIEPSVPQSSESDHKLSDTSAWPYRGRLPDAVVALLKSSNARDRFEATQAIWQAGDEHAARQLIEALAVEQDANTRFAMWNAVSSLVPLAERRKLLSDSRPSVRLGVLLGMLGREELGGNDVSQLARSDSDDRVRKWSNHWMAMTGHGLNSPDEIIEQLKRLDAQGPGVEARIRLLRKLTSLRLDDAQFDWILGRLFRVSDHEQYLPDLEQQRAWALRALASNRRALPLLWESLAHASAGVRDAAIDGFCRRDTESIDYLLDQMPAAPPAQREHAEDAIAALAAQASDWTATRARIEQLEKLYRSTANPRVRGAVLRLFAVMSEASDPIGRSTAMQLARSAAADEHPIVQEAVTLVGSQLGTPIPISAKHVPPSIDDVIARLPDASIERGRDLFFRQGGLGCAKCHRIGNAGAVFAPDLTTAPGRLTPRFVAESILKPSAVITEGYRSSSIVTSEGKVLTGVITRETSSSLELMQSDGHAVLVNIDEIEARKSQPVSIMPDGFAETTTAAELADLIAFILHKPATSAAVEQPASFEWKLLDDQLQIQLGSHTISSYFFRDPVVRRPYFANLRTASGIQVTRNHPPIPDKDTADHATMHPGVWLAFGDLSGNDFWRNVATVEHIRFQTEPQTSEQGLTFAVENRYLAADGRSEVCNEIARYQFRPTDWGWTLVWSSQFRADHPFDFGNQDEMGLGVRVAHELRVDGGTGEILNDLGDRNETAIWGKPFRWIDYSGRLNGKCVGITVVPSAANRNTCWAHCRNYGVLVANPFPRSTGKSSVARTQIAPGTTYELSFGLAIHEGQSSDHPSLKEITTEIGKWLDHSPRK